MKYRKILRLRRWIIGGYPPFDDKLFASAKALSNYLFESGHCKHELTKKEFKEITKNWQGNFNLNRRFDCSVKISKGTGAEFIEYEHAIQVENLYN